MPLVLPFTALFSAAGLQATSWGQGRFNWGPRLGALWLLLFGQVAFTGTVVGTWLRDGIDTAATQAGHLTAYLFGSPAGAAITYLMHWLPFAILGVFWLAAFAPGRIFSERMTWRIAWAGVFLPVFLTAVPGPAGHFLTWAVGFLASIGAAIIGGLFGWAASIRGAL